MTLTSPLYMGEAGILVLLALFGDFDALVRVGILVDAGVAFQAVHWYAGQNQPDK